MDGQRRREQALVKLGELAREFSQTYSIRDQRREFPHEEIEKLRAAGLLALTVPERFGGLGLGLHDTLEVTMLLAESFPSLAQIFGVHGGMVTTLMEIGQPDQVERILKSAVEENLFIGNATSERGSTSTMGIQTRFEEHPSGDGVLIRGTKFFTTGSLAADLLVVFGLYKGGLGVALATVGSPGLVIHDDWCAMGQRSTASGTIEFNDVHVPRDRVLDVLDFANPSPASLLGPSYQLGFAAMYVGIARGALCHAVEYIRTKSRPWLESGVSRAVEDPYVQADVGTLRAYLSAAESLVERAADRVGAVEAARVRGAERTELAALRAEAAVVVAEAKVVSSEVALRVCQDLFQSCGARATLADENLDRFWRDARTLTLHDPKSYKAKLIGAYLLADRRPPVSLLT